MVLADTSAWVEYDRATGSAIHLRLRELMLARDELAVTEPVIMELVMGARTDSRERDLRRLVRRFRLLRFEPALDFDGAARLYRRCRTGGVTPRGIVDCMIAAVALRHGATILASDVDMNRMGQIAGIQMDPASAA